MTIRHWVFPATPAAGLLLLLLVNQWSIESTNERRLQQHPHQHPHHRARASIGEDALDMRARRSFEKRSGMHYPGSSLGGEPLQCDDHEIHPPPLELEIPQGMQRATWIAAMLQKHGIGFPLSNSIEVGPCDSPIRLPGSIVVDQATVDWTPATEGRCKGLKPTFVDDAQHLRLIFDGAYDLLVAAHAIEHLGNPLLALSHWLRVVRPGGHLAIFLPDACSPNMMDRSRLAMPAAHYVAEYKSGRSEAHEEELAVSVLRFVRLFNSSNQFDPEPGYKSIEALSAERLRSFAREVQRPNFRGLGHMHAWSAKSLRGMLAAAEELFAKEGATPFRLLELGSFVVGTTGSFEFRFVLQRLGEVEPRAKRRGRRTVAQLEAEIEKRNAITSDRGSFKAIASGQDTLGRKVAT